MRIVTLALPNIQDLPSLRKAFSMATEKDTAAELQRAELHATGKSFAKTDGSVSVDDRSLDYTSSSSVDTPSDSGGSAPRDVLMVGLMLVL
jgi:hypothetical protein